MTVMIDWLTATIQTPPPLKHIYNAGFKRIIDHNGEVLRDEPSALDVEDKSHPSYSRHFRVSTPREDILRISGNPSKLLQGHNLFGCDDLNGYYLESGLFIRQAVGMFPSVQTYEACQFSKPRYSRVDVTRSFRFSTPADVPVFIREVIGSARSRSGRATLHGSETAYFNKGSRRWSLKVYDKHQEVLKRIPKNYRDQALSDLVEWSKGIVRFELVLRGQELDAVNQLYQLGQAPNWETIFDIYYNRIQFNENLAMKKVDPVMALNLKPTHKAVINLWQSGIDLRTVYPKNTFYRHRRDILTATGIDISSSPTDTDDSKVIDSQIDPEGWDPEPIQEYLVKPREDLKKAYKLL